jgi:hypothetical protein
MAFQKLGIHAIIAVAGVGILLTLTTLGLLSANQTIPFSGTITTVNVGVYSDSDCTQNCTSLSIGAVNPGGTANQTVYIKNTGTVPETLSMTISNWNPPSANSSLTLSWNLENSVLNAGQSIPATLTLTVASSPGSLTNFSCSITFTGTQET